MRSIFFRKNNQFGFTLVEIMVVLALVSVLATVIGIGSVRSGQQARDGERQADLRLLQNAVEAYKNKYGRYPEQCPATATGNNGWSGEIGTNFRCDDGTNRYILGDVTSDPAHPFSEFMPKLPTDPKKNGTDSGYTYITNSNGTVYKIMARNTVEGEKVDYNHPFKSCDITPSSTGGIEAASVGPHVGGWCLYGRIPPMSSAGAIVDCRKRADGGTNATDRFETSYGLWGGIEKFTPSIKSFSDPVWTGLSWSNKYNALRDTAIIICR